MSYADKLRRPPMTTSDKVARLADYAKRIDRRYGRNWILRLFFLDVLVFIADIRILCDRLSKELK